MQYFTPERFARLQDISSDANIVANLDDWEAAIKAYDAALNELMPELPESVQRFFQDKHLHDAKVLSISKTSKRLFIDLKECLPPHKQLRLAYTLAAPPQTVEGLFPEFASEDDLWLHDEFSRVNPGVFQHSILLSSGRELRIQFNRFAVERSTPLPWTATPAADALAEARG